MIGLLERWYSRWIMFRLRRRWSHLPAWAPGDFEFGWGFDVRFSDSGRLELAAPLYVDRYVCLKCKGRLAIGPRTYINRNVIIACREEIIIGSNVLIANNVSIYDHDHRCEDPARPYRDQGYHTGRIHIGDNVWIGAGATILRGVTLGAGAVIGAGAVVLKDVPAAEIWAGVPARFIRRVGPGNDGGNGAAPGGANV